MITLGNPLALAILSPYFKVNSLAFTTVHLPKLIEKPKTQFPCGPRKTPPAPAGPGLPREAPSKLSLIQSPGGESHWTKISL